MAIDTAAKRRSTIAVFVPWLLPRADGTVSTADRRHVGKQYSGIPSASVPAVAGPFDVQAAQVYVAGATIGGLDQ